MTLDASVSMYSVLERLRLEGPVGMINLSDLRACCATLIWPSLSRRLGSTFKFLCAKIVALLVLALGRTSIRRRNVTYF